ncbi:MAG: M48 family metallopeptidase [Blastocatellales bacterium]
MKLFANWHRMLTVIIISSLFISVLAAENPYDKFRNREYTNKGYLSEEEELKLAADVHQEILKQFRLSEDRRLNEYVNNLGQKLARSSERPKIPWRFYVVDDKSINAFATLGGRVYVHTGLIAATSNEAQLASVIGHEIGHIVGRHGLENVKKAQKLGMFAIGATIVGAILGGQGGAQAGEAIGSLVAGGFLMKHSRDAEREADFLGLYNIKAAGYNTGGMVEMFQMLQQVTKGGGSLGSILASHPDPRERESNTRLEIDQHLSGTDRRGISNTNDYQRLKGGAAINTAPATSKRKVRPRP